MSVVGMRPMHEVSMTASAPARENVTACCTPFTRKIIEAIRATARAQDAGHSTGRRCARQETYEGNGSRARAVRGRHVVEMFHGTVFGPDKRKSFAPSLPSVLLLCQPSGRRDRRGHRGLPQQDPAMDA